MTVMGGMEEGGNMARNAKEEEVMGPSGACGVETEGVYAMRGLE